MSTRNSLDRLADVELQLVMHGLDTSALLKVGRCAKRMYRLLSREFTWQHQSPKRIVIGHPNYEYVLTQAAVTSPALVHRPVHIRWSWTSSSEGRVRCVKDARMIARLSGVQSVDMSQAPTDADFWCRLMSLPVLATTLRALDCCMGHGDFTMIRGLQRLHTLAIHQGYETRHSAELLACLAECHELTALSYNHFGDSDNAKRQLEHIAACRRLKSLTLEKAMSVAQLTRAWPALRLGRSSADR
jgi:hypothetical protein